MEHNKLISWIKGWSIVVGILSLSSLLTLAVYPIASPVGLFSIIAIILGLAVAYAGVQVTSTSLSTVKGIFWTKFVWLILNLLLSLSSRADSFTRLLIIVAQGIIVGLLIMWVGKLPKKTSMA